jgi:GntR family transcriptional regulator of arabinose operon
MKEVDFVKPKYQVIVDNVRSNILLGTYKAGEQISTESALQDSYGVSRQTVRKAILELSNEGLLRSEN